VGKKGVELSMNFIVIIVLSVVALGFGMKLLMDMFDAGNKYVNMELSANQDAEISRLLGNERIATFPHSQDAFRGKQSVFAIGIKNTGSNTKFLMNATMKAAYNAANSELSYNLNKFKLTYFNSSEIAKDASSKQVVIVSVPKDAPSGTYVINIYACSGITTPLSCTAENMYDSVEKSYLIVK
jgi:hypothetical protein